MNKSLALSLQEKFADKYLLKRNTWLSEDAKWYIQVNKMAHSVDAGKNVAVKWGLPNEWKVFYKEVELANFLENNPYGSNITLCLLEEVV